MTTQIALVFVILFIATALLVTERVRSDVIALLTLVALALTRLVEPEEAFSGFSRAAVITILSIFIITAGLDRTGVTKVIGNRLLRLAGKREGRLIPVIMLAGAALSLFMNNIAAGAVLLPAVIGISRQTQVKPSKLLMPLAFATMLGGMATLLTTSNILVGNALRDAGLKGFSLFDFAPVGVPILLVGIAYMTFIGRGLLPNRDVTGPIRRATPKELAELYGLRQGVCHIYVLIGSGMAGQTIAGGGWSDKLGLTVIGVSRGGHMLLSPGKDLVIIEGDVVLAGGQTDDTELSYFGLLRTDDPNWSGELASDEVNLVEVVLSPRSEFINKTLKEINFRNKTGLTVLSIWRRGSAIRDVLGDIPLQWGDAMLVQGPTPKLNLLRTDPNLLILDDVGETPTLQPRKGPLAALIAVIAAAVATAELVPIATAAFAGALVMVLAGCLTMDEAYKSVEWRSIFLISGFIPLGVALDHTGAAALLGRGLVDTLGQFGPIAVAAGLFVATALFLQIVGNVGAAVIFAPIAISAAEQIGSDPRAFAMAVALGASMAFLIPTAHPVNVMMMGPGGYTVKDFTKVGWGLTAALLLVVIVVLPVVWKL